MLENCKNPILFRSIFLLLKSQSEKSKNHEKTICFDTNDGLFFVIRTKIT